MERGGRTFGLENRHLLNEGVMAPLREMVKDLEDQDLEDG